MLSREHMAQEFKCQKTTKEMIDVCHESIIGHLVSHIIILSINPPNGRV